MFAALSVTRLGQATVAAQSTGDYVIGPQDVLTVQVFDQADLGGKYTVETDGTFTFPLVGRVKAGGLTLRSFEGRAQGQTRRRVLPRSAGHRRNRTVSEPASLRHGRGSPAGPSRPHRRHHAHRSARPGRVDDLRSLRRRGNRPAPQGTAHGPLLLNQSPGTEVFRASIRELESGQLAQNIELRDGDTIFVPRAETVYVFGQVKTPGAYGIQVDTTVLQALSLAGGVTEQGAMNRIRVMRIENGTKKEIKVQLTDTLRPGDTIIVPQRFF